MTSGNERNQRFQESVEQEWVALKYGLREDVAEYARIGVEAEFAEITGSQCRIANLAAGLAVTITADLAAFAIQYTFEATKKNVAAPEGGTFSLHAVNQSDAELHSADERISNKRARFMILEPLLLPKLPARAA